MKCPHEDGDEAVRLGNCVCFTCCPLDFPFILYSASLEVKCFMFGYLNLHSTYFSTLELIQKIFKLDPGTVWLDH